jgi:hypothetical protein
MGAGDRIEHVARCGVLEEGAAGTGTPDVLDVLVHLERGELDGLADRHSHRRGVPRSRCVTWSCSSMRTRDIGRT